VNINGAPVGDVESLVAEFSKAKALLPDTPLKFGVIREEIPPNAGPPMPPPMPMLTPPFVGQLPLGAALQMNPLQMPLNPLQMPLNPLQMPMNPLQMSPQMPQPTPQQTQQNEGANAAMQLLGGQGGGTFNG